MPLTNSENKNKQLVWYASYGSNMNENRFACYIAGGTPVGGARKYVGCDDKRLPAASRAVELPHELYFAGKSTVWYNGGVAFIGLNAGKGAAKAKAYLITVHQLEQIDAQENWRNKKVSVNLPLLQDRGRVTVEDGRGYYDEIIYSGEMDGFPIVSFTATHEKRPYTKPDIGYLQDIVTGLVKTHYPNIREAVDYLITKPGVQGNYRPEEIIGAFS